MARYIDADRLKRQMEFVCMGIMSGTDPYNAPLNEIDEAPTADVVERKDLDTIIEAHEQIGYEKGFRDGYAEAIEDSIKAVGLNTWAGSRISQLPTADVKEIQKYGEWEMFDLISSAYFGKGMYFKQDNGTVYSRYSCKHMSVDEAIREFVSLIDDSDVNLQPTVDAVDVVRCKDCKHWERDVIFQDGWCRGRQQGNPDWFCADGERREA